MDTTRTLALGAAAGVLTAWSGTTACAQSAPAPSDSGVHVNVGALVADADTRPDALTGGIVRAGARLGRTDAARVLALEAELGTGFGSRDEQDGDVLREAELDSVFGVFALARLPLGVDARGRSGGSVFARVGYGRHSYSNTREETFADGTVELRDRVADRTVGGIAFGLGAEAFFGTSRRNGVRIDGLAVFDGTDELSLGGLFGVDGSGYASVAYVRRF